MKRNPYRQAAQLYRLLSHPVRVHVLDELRRDEACVCHLQAVLGRPQAYVSQQLRVLREAKVVADRKDGMMVYYRLANRQVAQMLEDTLGPAGERTQPPNCPCPKCAPPDSEARRD